jgi:glycosyltransferase involved in cell wall biosynthesis
MLASIVIPVAPYHRDTAQAAIESAEAQTLASAVYVIEDTHQRGAGWARNQGAWKVRTPLVVFLDADDILHPQFVARCAQVYREQTYVYSDWSDPRGEVHTLPDCTAHKGWYAGKVFHLITTLMPTAYVHQVGGFDETLPTMEDLQFYLKIGQLGVCGIRCPETLVRYNAHKGQRAKLALQNGLYAQYKKQFREEFKPMGCGCGSGSGQRPKSVNVQQENDVLAVAQWVGKRTYASYNGLRTYRARGGEDVWVDPEDLKLQPKLFQLKPTEPHKTAPTVSEVQAMALEALGG